MKFEQVAARLGVTVHQVAGLDDHPGGCIARLADGSRWLITDTVARRYVPDIDDEPAADLEDEEDQTGEGEGPEGAQVPAGTVEEVLAWVSEDRERADQALAAEQAKTAPRSTLVAKLEAFASQEA